MYQWKSSYLLAIPLLVVFLWIASNTTKTEELYVIPLEEALKRLVYQDNLEFLLAAHYNKDGHPLSEDERRLLNEGKLARTYYQNKDGRIRQVRCFPMSSDKALDERRLAKLLGSNFSKNHQQIDLSCSDDNMEHIYNLVIKKDTILATQSESFHHFENIPKDIIVHSIIEQCRFPFEKKTVEAAWEIIYHSSNNGLRELYYDQFKKAYEKELLLCDKFMDLEDKIMRRKKFKSKTKKKFNDPKAYKEFLQGFSIDSLEVTELVKNAGSFSFEVVVEN